MSRRMDVTQPSCCPCDRATTGCVQRNFQCLKRKDLGLVDGKHNE